MYQYVTFNQMFIFHLGIPNADNEWGLKLDIHEPDDEIQYWFSVTIDLDKEGEQDSSVQVSQIKVKGNVAQVRIEVIHFCTFSSKVMFILVSW